MLYLRRVGESLPDATIAQVTPNVSFIQTPKLERVW